MTMAAAATTPAFTNRVPPLAAQASSGLPTTMPAGVSGWALEPVSGGLHSTTPAKVKGSSA